VTRPDDEDDPLDTYLPPGVPLTDVLRDPGQLNWTGEEPPECVYEVDIPTFVVSGPLWRDENRPGRGTGRRFTWDEARTWVTATYGTPLGRVRLNGRWAFRVNNGQRARYTPPPEETLPERARLGRERTFGPITPPDVRARLRRRRK
jgi:hypothetical protein